MLKHIISTLKEAVVWRWPGLLIRSLMDRSAIMKKTRWAGDGVPVAEARYVKQFSLAAAAYLNLRKKIGQERAVETMRALLIPIGCAAVQKRFLSLDLSTLHGMDRLLAFNDRMNDRPLSTLIYDRRLRKKLTSGRKSYNNAFEPIIWNHKRKLLFCF